MHKPLVSIIVPVYNIEQYLQECIESILNQVYENYEVILINDGSTDNSLQICNELSKNNKNIKVLDKANSGPSSARNEGIKVAKGKYISFIDGDDMISEYMIEKMVSLAEFNQADVVICGYETFPNGKKSYFNYYSDKPLTPYEFIKYNKKIHSHGDLCFSWRYVYKKELIDSKNIKFNEDIKIGEDVIFNLEVIMESNRICTINDTLYYYRTNRVNSLMRTPYKPFLEEHLKLQYNEKIRLSKKYGLDKIDDWMEDLSYCYIYGFKSMLLENLYKGKYINKRKEIKRIMNFKMFRDSYKYIGFKGNCKNFKEFIAFLAFKYNISSIECYLCRRMNK